MKTIFLILAMATQQPQTETPQGIHVVVEYPNHTFQTGNCINVGNRYKCHASPQSFISDLGGVYFINESILQCIKYDFQTTVIFDCTNYNDPPF